MDSIIFDLDGTLWDPTEVVVTAWNNVLSNHKEINKKITKEELEAVLGLQVEDIGKKLFPQLDEDLQRQILSECCEVECRYLGQLGGRLYDHAERVLKSLSHKYKLFIVSNCQDGYIETFYKFHKLDKYFLDYENPGRTGLSKGENIKLIIERNNLLKPVYIGDTEGDQKATKFAGIPFIYAEYGFGEVTSFDYSIKNLDELLELF
jgi:phosphoglycolate phosphatase